MTGIFSEVETEMGQEREHWEGRRGEARSQHCPLSRGPGAPAILSCLRSQWLLTLAVGQDQQLPWNHTMWGCGQHPKAPWITRGQHGLRGPPPAGAPEGWRLGCDSLVRWREEVGSIRGNGF